MQIKLKIQVQEQDITQNWNFEVCFGSFTSYTVLLYNAMKN